MSPRVALTVVVVRMGVLAWLGRAWRGLLTAAGDRLELLSPAPGCHAAPRSPAAGAPDGVPDAPAAPQAGAPSPVPPFPPAGPGTPQRDTWVHAQGAPGSPLPTYAVRRDALITVMPGGTLLIDPGVAPPVTVLRTLTAPNPVLADDTVPLRIAATYAIVRPCLTLTDADEAGNRRVVWTDAAQWIRDRDGAAA